MSHEHNHEVEGKKGKTKKAQQPKRKITRTLWNMPIYYRLVWFERGQHIYTYKCICTELVIYLCVASTRKEIKERKKTTTGQIKRWPFARYKMCDSAILCV